MKLEPANDRGFLLGEFEDKYGAKCSIQESSLATDRCIWLGIHNPEMKVMGQKGWEDFKLPEGVSHSGRMHLNQQMVKDLLPLLQHFARTGELPAKPKKKAKKA